jgi:hypothetical protein
MYTNYICLSILTTGYNYKGEKLHGCHAGKNPAETATKYVHSDAIEPRGISRKAGTLGICWAYDGFGWLVGHS